MQPLHDGLEYRSFTYPYIGENTGIFGVQDYLQAPDNSGWDYDTGTDGSDWSDPWSSGGQNDFSGWGSDWGTSPDGGLFLG